MPSLSTLMAAGPAARGLLVPAARASQTRSGVGRLLPMASSTVTGTVFLLIPGYTAHGLAYFANLYRQTSPFNLGQYGEIYVWQRHALPECDLDEEASQLEARLLEMRGVKRLVIIGHSMGGAIAVKLLLRLKSRRGRLWRAAKAGGLIALSSPLTRADISVPLELGPWWLWPRAFNTPLQTAYMRATGRRLQRGTGRAHHLAIRRDARLSNRHMNGLTNVCRRGQLAALSRLSRLQSGALRGVPLQYLQAERDPLVRPTAAVAYQMLFAAPASSIRRLPRTWHADLPGQPEAWGQAIRQTVRAWCEPSATA